MSESAKTLFALREAAAIYPNHISIGALRQCAMMIISGHV